MDDGRKNEASSGRSSSAVRPGRPVRGSTGARTRRNLRHAPAGDRSVRAPAESGESMTALYSSPVSAVRGAVVKGLAALGVAGIVADPAAASPSVVVLHSA